MNETSLGIKTLTDKVRKIETVVSSLTDNVVAKTGIESFLEDLRKSKESEKVKKLQALKDQFENGLYATFKGTNLNKIVSQVVHYAIVFVEENIPQIAALIGEAISGQLKLTTVINFVKGVIPNIDEDEVSNMISHLVNVIFNNGTTITSPITSAVSLPVAAPPSSSLVKRRKSVSFSAFAKKS